MGHIIMVNGIVNVTMLSGLMAWLLYDVHKTRIRWNSLSQFEQHFLNTKINGHNWGVVKYKKEQQTLV